MAHYTREARRANLGRKRTCKGLKEDFWGGGCSGGFFGDFSGCVLQSLEARKSKARHAFWKDSPSPIYTLFAILAGAPFLPEQRDTFRCLVGSAASIRCQQAPTRQCNALSYGHLMLQAPYNREGSSIISASRASHCMECLRREKG